MLIAPVRVLLLLVAALCAAGASAETSSTRDMMLFNSLERRLCHPSDRILAFVGVRVQKARHGNDDGSIFNAEWPMRVRLVVNDGHRPGDIIVRVSAKRLRYYLDRCFAVEFPVATARPGIQFYGRTRITRKRKDPTWIPTPNQRKLYPGLPAFVPPGDDNPLGSRALNLAQGNLRIHGTNEAETIGRAVSDGCVRMRNIDIEALFRLVKVGATVTFKR